MRRMPKKILIAPDSFKGSIDSPDVCRFLAQGILEVAPETRIILLPLSDGGEGFLNVFQSSMNGELISVNVSGPLGEPVTVRYFILQPDNVAIIEMAEAAGLMLVPPDKRNPLKTSSYGLGQMICHALDQGIRNFIIGIGGSATTDGGAGMAQALGVKFYDNEGNEIVEHLNGGLLGSCQKISPDTIHSAVKSSNFQIACDVENPLLGPQGAVYTYSLQKGASPEELTILETNMQNYSRLLESTFQRNISMVFGAGAAGGLGAGLLAFLDAKLESGTRLILDSVQINRKLEGADLVITGEGKIDNQTFQGKLVSGVLARARQYSVPVIGVAGKIELNSDDLSESGLSRCYSLVDECHDEDYAIRHAGELLKAIGRRLAENEISKSKAEQDLSKWQKL